MDLRLTDESLLATRPVRPRGAESSLPAVLCVVDRPRWAHDRKTEALARELAGQYRIIRRYQSEVSAEDLSSADLILLFFWLQVERLGEDLISLLRARRDRLLIGICSHIELEGNWRQPGLRLLADLPAAVFANNRGLFETFQPLLGRPVAYTPNGVDTRFFHPPATARTGEGFRVGWAGSLTNHGAGHRGVEEIIAPAVAQVSGAELCLAAREQYWRDAEEMRTFYHSLDVYVCASRSEGTPNPCLEAAACGLPVVTTRVGNMPEFIRDGENGLFVERDPDDLAHALRRLAHAAELRLRLGARARESAEAWSWPRQAARYAALFEEALAGSAGSKRHPPAAGL